MRRTGVALDGGRPGCVRALEPQFRGLYSSRRASCPWVPCVMSRTWSGPTTLARESALCLTTLPLPPSWSPLLVLVELRWSASWPPPGLRVEHRRPPSDSRIASGFRHWCCATRCATNARSAAVVESTTCCSSPSPNSPMYGSPRNPVSAGCRRDWTALDLGRVGGWRTPSSRTKTGHSGGRWHPHLTQTAIATGQRWKSRVGWAGGRRTPSPRTKTGHNGTRQHPHLTQAADATPLSWYASLHL